MPDAAFGEARKRLPQVLRLRRLDEEPFLAYLALLATLVQTVELEVYSGFEAVARKRLARRDARVAQIALKLYF